MGVDPVISLAIPADESGLAEKRVQVLGADAPSPGLQLGQLLSELHI
jgi:hypothetical protein